MADAITNYVADRVIERERALEGDWLVKRGLREPGRERSRLDVGMRETLDRSGLGWVIAAFLFGVLIGAAALLTYAWVRVSV
jgi:hypothetical protein